MPRSYQPQSKSPFKPLLLLLLLLWGGWMLLSPYGLWQYAAVSRQLSALKAENSRLQEENRRLQDEIDRLRDDDAYIEEVARREYDFLRDHELLFDFR